jgi:signal transduction histidine kinase
MNDLNRSQPPDKSKNREPIVPTREVFFELLNGLTRKILVSTDWDSALHALAFDIKELIGADDCYILGWDEERQWPIPVTTTAKLEFPFSSHTLGRDSVNITTSALAEARVLTVEDARNSRFMDIRIASQYPSLAGIAVPLIAGGHKLGAVIVGYNTVRQFTAVEIERAELAGNQVALALWTFQQSLEIQQRLKESHALAKIERMLSETERIGIERTLQLIVDSARELMPHAEKSVLHLWNAEQQILVAEAVSGFSESERKYGQIRIRLGQGVAGRVMQDGKTINAGDVRSFPHFLLRGSEPAFQALMVASIQSGGQSIGTLSVASNIKHAFSSTDERLLDALAVQSGIAIENTRLFEATQQRLKEVQTLYQISRGLAGSLDADQLIRDMISLIQRSFDYYHVQIYLVEQETRNLLAQHGSGYIGSELVKYRHSIPVGEGIVGHVAVTGEAFMTNNVESVLFYKRHPLLSQTQFEIAVPIKIEEQVMGVLDIQQTADHPKFTSNDLLLMTSIADHLAIVLQKANLYGTLQTSLQKEQEMRSQLLQSERLALVGRLLASVSHELNNPIQAIQYGLFVLKDEPDLPAPVKEDLGVIIAEAERLTALIERLRSAYGPVRLSDFQSISLNALIEDVYALVNTYMRHGEISFQFLPESNLPAISGLPDQIRQVLLNLFFNAVEAMQPGGCLTVETRFLPEQEQVLLIVKDTGPGIDPEILPRIFDAFITSKGTGTGLGLAITHDIIQQHHGRIAVENGPNGGALFKVWLPIDRRNGK